MYWKKFLPAKAHEFCPLNYLWKLFQLLSNCGEILQNFDGIPPFLPLISALEYALLMTVQRNDSTTFYSVAFDSAAFYSAKHSINGSEFSYSATQCSATAAQRSKWQCYYSALKAQVKSSLKTLGSLTRKTSHIIHLFDR